MQWHVLFVVAFDCLICGERQALALTSVLALLEQCSSVADGSHHGKVLYGDGSRYYMWGLLRKRISS